MSKVRVITGRDDRGRPVSEWREEGAAETGQHFGFMQPAFEAVVERRQATAQELEAMRARDEPPVPRPPTIVRRSLATPEEEPAMPPEIHVLPTPRDDDAPAPLVALTELAAAANAAAEAWVAENEAHQLADMLTLARREAQAALDAAYQAVCRREAASVPKTAPEASVKPARRSQTRETATDGLTPRQRHQIEPVHIAYDLAHGIPLAAWQMVAPR